jgi:hypothetical protein
MNQRAEYWRGMIAAWARSGLSQAEYCRRQGIQAVTFSWWKRRLSQAEVGAGDRRQDRFRSAAVKAGFVEVRVPQLTRAAYEVVLPGGRTVRVPGDFDAQVLGRLIAVVEAAGTHPIEGQVPC